MPPGTTTCGTTCNGAWTDACQLQASDKCSGILTNLLYMSSPVVSLPTWISFGSVYSSVSLYNIIVGGQKFILPPVWDNSQSACTMGGVVPSSSSSSAGSCTNAPATNSLGQCGPGFGSCPTPSNPYCSQYGNCGSTSDYSTKAQTAFNYCGGASTSSTTSSSSSSSCLYSPASPTGGQCGAGVGSCPSSSNPYCSQYGNCGSTSAYSTNGQSAYNYCK